MIKIFKKHKVIIYLSITFILTWILWITAFTINNKNTSLLRIIGSFMPSVVTVFLCAYDMKKDGLKALINKLFLFKVSPIYYIFIFTFSAASIYIPYLLCNLLGFNYKFHINSIASGFKINSPLQLLLFFFAILIFGGPLGEEIGWRGYVLPKLEERFSPITSSIIVGIIWTCWHLPMFYFNIAGYNISFVSYFVETIYLSFIFTFLYNKTKGSLFTVILFHTVDNFIMSILINDFMTRYNAYYISAWIFRIIVLIIIVISMKQKNSKPYRSTSPSKA